jgi:hypothetical protein
MQDEILNLDFHIKRLTLLALNKTASIEAAAAMLGITGRTVHRYIKTFDIKRHKEYRRRGVVGGWYAAPTIIKHLPGSTQLTKQAI